MGDTRFRTGSGRTVPAVTAEEMREVDRIAVDDVGLQLLQMMENAGRALAGHVRDVAAGPALVVAGSGGNGGGGLACARHLSNRDVPVEVVLDRPPESLTGAAAAQHGILDEMGVTTRVWSDGSGPVDEAAVVVDALVGYGLDGEVREPARSMIDATNDRDQPVVALDVPSGLDATTGERLGTAVRSDWTVTLALPKTGLREVGGQLFLADIAIPATVYARAGIEYETPFDDADWVELTGTT